MVTYIEGTIGLTYSTLKCNHYARAENSTAAKAYEGPGDTKCHQVPFGSDCIPVIAMHSE